MSLDYFSERIQKLVEKVHLDLSNKVILTEAATGSYSVTPIIAALAGAKVYALAKNTSYGDINQIKKEIYKLGNYFTFSHPIEIITELTPAIIAQADIITNSGHLRPLTEDVLKHIKSNAIISLMYEKWEIRASDIDLDFCKKNKIKICATNEKHPNIDVFSFLCDMAIKLIFDSGKCLYNEKYILITNNEFGPYIANKLSFLTQVGVISNTDDKKNYNFHDHCEWLCDFSDITIPESYKDTTGIILSCYPFEKTWIGEGIDVPIQGKLLSQCIDDPFVLRFTGDICKDSLNKLSIKYFPQNVKRGHMGILPSDIGWEPIIRLQVGGLKSAQEYMVSSGNFEYSQDVL